MPLDSSRRRRDASTLRSVLINQDTVCAKCGGTERLEVDHIIPFGIGGDDDYHNLQVLCHDCHVAKGDIALVKKTRYADPKVKARILEKFYAAFPNGFAERQRKIGEARKRAWDRASPERRAEITAAVQAGWKKAGFWPGRKCDKNCNCGRHRKKKP